MDQSKLYIKYILILVLTSNAFWSQNLILRGTVKGANNEKLVYVNIGIKNKNIGTISNENGQFSIRINEKNKSDSLSFSYLGYTQHTIKISDILEKKISEFVLDEELFALDEVLIISKKTKEKKLGTKSYVSFVVGDVRADNNQNNNIQEFAKKLNIKKPSKLLEVHIALSNVNINSAKFRVNFYNIKDKLPFRRVGSRNIIIEKQITNGWNTFDLKKFDLKFEKPVFISIEYLPKEYNDEAPFRYNGQLLGRSIKRTSSLGTWDVTKGAKIAMYVRVRQ